MPMFPQSHRLLFVNNMANLWHFYCGEKHLDMVEYYGDFSIQANWTRASWIYLGYHLFFHSWLSKNIEVCNLHVVHSSCKC